MHLAVIWRFLSVDARISILFGVFEDVLEHTGTKHKTIHRHDLYLSTAENDLV